MQSTSSPRHEPLIRLEAGLTDPADAQGANPAARVPGEIGGLVNGLAAQSRAPGISVAEVLTRAASPPAVLIDDLAVRLLDWPAGCTVARGADGWWAAWFTRAGCRYSCASLDAVNEMAWNAAYGGARA